MLAAWISTTTSPGPAVGSGTSPSCSTSGPPCFVNNTAFMGSSRLSLPLQKLDQQLAHPLRLLLLHPMAGAVDQMAAKHPRARALLHPLEIAGPLVSPPILFAGDKDRGHIDGPARKQLQLSRVEASCAAPIPLQPALEPVSLILGGVHCEFVLRQPTAGCDLGSGR